MVGGLHPLQALPRILAGMPAPGSNSCDTSTPSNCPFGATHTAPRAPGDPQSLNATPPAEDKAWGPCLLQARPTFHHLGAEWAADLGSSPSLPHWVVGWGLSFSICVWYAGSSVQGGGRCLGQGIKFGGLLANSPPSSEIWSLTLRSSLVASP